MPLRSNEDLKEILALIPGASMCLGCQLGSPDGVEARAFLKKKKNLRIGLTFEFKKITFLKCKTVSRSSSKIIFFKCKMVSSSSEKHPWVFVNHSLNRSQQKDAAVNNAKSTLGCTSVASTSKARRTPWQHRQDIEGMRSVLEGSSASSVWKERVNQNVQTPRKKRFDVQPAAEI